MSCFSGSESKTSASSKTGKQTEYLNKAVELYGKTLGQNQVYPGQMVAPFSDLQTSALKGTQNYTDYFSTPQTVDTPLYGETGSAISGLLSGKTGAKPLTGEDVQSYFTEKYYQPAMTSLKRDVLPLVDESYAGPGYFGGARSHARADTVRDVNEQLAQLKAELDWNVLTQNQALEEAKAGRTLSTLPSAMSYGEVPAKNAMQNLEIAAGKISGLKEIFGFGQAEQTQEQIELQAELQKWMDENEITDPENLSILLTLLGMNMSISSGSSSGPGLGYVFAGSAAQQAGGNLGDKFFQ